MPPLLLKETLTRFIFASILSSAGDPLNVTIPAVFESVALPF